MIGSLVFTCLMAMAVPTTASKHKTVKKDLFSALSHPQDCDLRLLCTVSRFGDDALKGSDFLRGIRALTGVQKNYKSFRLFMALKTGESGGDCTSLTPKCEISEVELLEAVKDLGLMKSGRFRRDTSRRLPPVNRSEFLFNPLRRQSVFSGMPPVLRPEDARSRRICRTCDSRGTVCTVYSIGTYAGCTGAWLMAGFPGQIACNVATAPGSIGCGINTLNCYMQGCGLLSLPRF